MADPHLKSILERKCAEIEVLIEQYRRQLADAQSDLVHVRATISLFERDGEPGRERPIVSIAGVFKRGELLAQCQLALRQQGPELTTTQLASICLKAKALDADDRALHRSLVQAIAQVMDDQRRQGQIDSPGKSGVARIWCLPTRIVAA